MYLLSRLKSLAAFVKPSYANWLKVPSLTLPTSVTRQIFEILPASSVATSVGASVGASVMTASVGGSVAAGVGAEHAVIIAIAIATMPTIQNLFFIFFLLS